MTRLLAFLIALLAVEAMTLAGADLAWKSQTIELTTRPGEAVAEADFTFVNASRTAVVVTGVDTGCSCTRAKIDRTQVGPGEKGTVHVAVALAGIAGRRDESVNIYTDRAKGIPDELHLLLTVPESYLLTPSLLTWRRGSPLATQVLQVRAVDGSSVRLLQAAVPRAPFKTKLVELEAGKRYEVSVAPTSTAVPDTFVVTLQLSVNGGPPFWLNAYALITND